MKINLFSVAALVGCIASTSNATTLTQQAFNTNYLVQTHAHGDEKAALEAAKKYAPPGSKIKKLGEVGDDKNPAIVFELEVPAEDDPNVQKVQELEQMLEKERKKNADLEKQAEEQAQIAVLAQTDSVEYKEGLSQTNLPALPVHVHSRVFMDVCVGQRQYCDRIVYDLFASTPKTSENFRALCTGEKGNNKSGQPLHYAGSTFHRVIPGFMAQGGDFTNNDGTGGESIYGERFPDESFNESHNARGLLSMANAGPNTNGSQFYITFQATPHLDGKHVVFGKVVEGWAMVDALEKIGQANGEPKLAVNILNSGWIL